MKHLVLVIGILAVSVWRSLASLALSALLYLPRRAAWPERATLSVHVCRGDRADGHGLPVLLGHRPRSAGTGDRADLHRAADRLLLAALVAWASGSAQIPSVDPSPLSRVWCHRFGQARTPVGHEALLGIAAIIGSALCYAFNIVLMRRQALARANPLEINFFQCADRPRDLDRSRIPFAGVPAWPGVHWGWIIVAIADVDRRYLAVRLGLCAR